MRAGNPPLQPSREILGNVHTSAECHYQQLVTQSHPSQYIADAILARMLAREGLSAVNY